MAGFVMASPITRTYVNWHGDREPRTVRAVRSSMSDRVAAVRGSVPPITKVSRRFTSRFATWDFKISKA